MRAVALLLLAACSAPAAPEADGGADLREPRDLAGAPGDGPAVVDLSGDLGAECRTDKMTFTQATGCQNDGSVEFCLSSTDPALLMRAKAIAPTLRCAAGVGRAGCRSDSQLLCLFPTGMAECVSMHGALDDAAWARLCQLAALPEVKRIVPTWLE